MITLFQFQFINLMIIHIINTFVFLNFELFINYFIWAYLFIMEKPFIHTRVIT